MQDPAQMLEQNFGYSEFRPGQEAVIEHLLAGRSAAAVFPTGGGKSLCYQLPAVMLDGLTLVVSPLIALMKDQIDALQSLGIKASRLDSSLGVDEYRQVMDEVHSGELKLLYVAPERFNNERFRASLARVRISLFAIDEAHCISEWGHNFRPDYLKLVNHAAALKAERVLALTATATRAVLADICRVFDIADECAVSTGFYRNNLHLRATAVDARERDQRLLHLLQQQQTELAGACIVYVTLQKTAVDVAARLTAAGLEARCYHAGLKDEARESVQEWFLGSSTAIVVATIAFGMGIDKADIRAVYHYNLPKSLENYSQEIGRAGRDGNIALCHALVCLEDLIPLENFVYGDTPAATAIAAFTETIFAKTDEFDISQYELSMQCDIRQLVLRTLLTRLELDGYIAAGTPFYAKYQFKYLTPRAQVLAGFDSQRQAFLSDVFEQATDKKIWSEIDPAAAAIAIGCERSRIITALEYLQQQGLLDIKVTGIRYRYRILKRPEQTRVLADELSQDAAEREQREIGRLHQVLEWLALSACQSSALAERFDRPLPTPCGHCNWCVTQSPLQLPEREATEPDAALLAEALELQQLHPDTMKSAVELARFLCGISSPGVSKARLGRHRLFGVMQQVPYQQVLEACARQGNDQ